MKLEISVEITANFIKTNFMSFNEWLNIRGSIKAHINILMY